ncbi:MAG: putative toxin-antitoxin system toxin component, PIN family [Victivallales bacterium]
MPQKNIKVIVDTNILISAILKDRLPEKMILRIIEDGSFDWIASEEIVQEYKTVISRPKFLIPGDEIKFQFDLIDRMTTIVCPDLKIIFKRDQKDAKFLSCALVSNADFLITGDSDLVEIVNYNNTKIISVPEFAALFNIA